MKTRMFTFEIMWMILAALLFWTDALASVRWASGLVVCGLITAVSRMAYWPIHVRPPPVV